MMQPAYALRKGAGIKGTWSCECDGGNGTCSFSSGPSGGFCEKKKGDTCTGTCTYYSSTTGAKPPAARK
jgi:hypothetical protein